MIYVAFSRACRTLDIRNHVFGDAACKPWLNTVAFFLHALHGAEDGEASQC